jgi:hypothetical protein
MDGVAVFNIDKTAGRTAKEKRKKMTRKKVVRGAVFVLMAALVLALAGCGGGNPKTLAKQTYDIGLQAVGAMFDPAKAAELEKKVEDIEKKVAKLSPADRTIYEAELTRLGEEAAKAMADLYKSAEDALKASGALSDDALKAANDAANLLKDFGF